MYTSYHTFQEIPLELEAAPFVAIISLGKMLETTVVFLLFFSHFGEAYNVDTTSPVDFKEDGLFGLSVALSENYVYVGAPKDGTRGNVFKCPTSRGSCSVVGGKTFEIFDALIFLLDIFLVCSEECK